MKALWCNPRAFIYFFNLEAELKTLVIGLGNPILGDDGVGWRVSQELKASTELPPEVDVVSLDVSGLSLMEALIGYKKAIIIDAIVTHQEPLGKVSCFPLNELPNPSSGHLSSTHDTSLQSALKIGWDLGYALPDEIIMVAIESQKVYDFSEELSTAVSAAVPEAVKITRGILLNNSPQDASGGEQEKSQHSSTSKENPAG